jgi:hypothetical protein
MELRVRLVACSVLAVIALAIALGSSALTSWLPERYVTTDWPVDVDFASGAPFKITLPKLLKGWQNLEVTAEVQNKEWREHGIVATHRLKTHVRARQTGAPQLHCKMCENPHISVCKQQIEQAVR